MTFTSAPLDRDPDCDPGTSDGSGFLGLPIFSSFSLIVPPDGGAPRSIRWTSLQLLEQRQGFVSGTANVGAMPSLEAFAENGDETAEINNVGTFAVDPTGGVVAVIWGGWNAADQLTAFDDAFRVRWSTPLPNDLGDVLTIGVDRLGNTLVLALEPSNDGDLVAVWFDAQGNPGPTFDPGTLDQNDTYVVLTPKIGSGLFAATVSYTQLGQSTWSRTFPSLEPSWEPIPDWLARRPNTDLHMAHGGTAYAVLPRIGAWEPLCEQAMEIVSADGQSCSAVFQEPGGTCSALGLTVGYDGTVIQQLPRTCAADGRCSCRWQWWPGLLK